MIEAATYYEDHQVVIIILGALCALFPPYYPEK